MASGIYNKFKVARYLSNPINDRGCPMCGTLLYTRKSEPVRSRAVNTGKNYDRDTYRDDRSVRCGRCGFMCNTQRDIQASEGSTQGNGIKYNVEAV